MRPSTGIQESLSPNSQNKVTSGRKDHKGEKVFDMHKYSESKNNSIRARAFERISKTLT